MDVCAHPSLHEIANSPGGSGTEVIPGSKGAKGEQKSAKRDRSWCVWHFTQGKLLKEGLGGNTKPSSLPDFTASQPTTEIRATNQGS